MKITGEKGGLPHVFQGEELRAILERSYQALKHKTAENFLFQVTYAVTDRENSLAWPDMLKLMFWFEGRHFCTEILNLGHGTDTTIKREQGGTQDDQRADADD